MAMFPQNKKLISYWQSLVKVIPLKFFITNFFAAPGFVFTKGDVLFTPLGLLRAEKLALFWLFWVVSVILFSSCFNLLPIFSLFEEFLFLRVFTRSSPCWASWTWVLVRLDIEVHDTAVATLRVFLKNEINICKICFDTMILTHSPQQHCSISRFTSHYENVDNI